MSDLQIKIIKMKNTNIKLLLLCLLAGIMAVGCKKSEYLTDGGVHDPVTPLSNYDYLKQHSWNSFDTLIAIIDHFNLKEEVNKAPTFFAPTNYSITKFVNLKKSQRLDPTLPYTIDSLFNIITADSIRQYMFSNKITVAESPTVITPVTSIGKTTCAIQKFLQTDGSYYQWGNTPVYSLYLIRVRGAIDDPNATPVPDDPNADTRIICQTTGIQTSSGATIMHVLSNAHTFVRF
jgi:hypothetical protein